MEGYTFLTPPPFPPPRPFLKVLSVTILPLEIPKPWRFCKIVWDLPLGGNWAIPEKNQAVGGEDVAAIMAAFMLNILSEDISSWFRFGFFCFVFYHNESHLQYKPPKHEIEETFTALIQYKTRYKDPYLQPEECKGKNKQTKKQTLKNEMKWMKIINLLSPIIYLT